MNYYERHLGDYARDAGHLSMLEHGAYSLLLDRYYTTEQPIPNKTDAYRICRARSRDEKAAVDAVLREFFVTDGEAFLNRRAEEEIVKARSRIEAARTNGAKGGRPKSNRNETQQEPGGFPAGNPDLTRTKAHHTPDTTIASKMHGGAAEKPPRATRKCPDAFVVTEAMADWAKQEFPSVPIARETEAFRDHTFKTAISDWPGAWRNWIRRASTFAPAAKATTRQTEVAKWLGPLGKAKQGEIIDMEEGNGPRIAMG